MSGGCGAAVRSCSMAVVEWHDHKQCVPLFVMSSHGMACMSSGAAWRAWQVHGMAMAMAEQEA